MHTTSEHTAVVAGELEQIFGLAGVDIRYGLSQSELFDEAIANDRGRVRPGGPDGEQKAFPTALGKDGPLIFYSDPSCTGRPVKDTFAVARPEIADTVWWKDSLSPFDPAAFDALLPRVIEHLNAKGARLYVTDVFCGWDPEFAEPYRFVGEFATHAFFCNIMFPHGIRADADRVGAGWTMLNVPTFHCDPARDGTRSERAVIIDIVRRIALVLGRADYCGVNKKTMFTVMNYVLPSKGQLSMHCSANVGAAGDTAILFGLSGTGKTTLSADPDRELIGDDEHIWTDSGIANFENGCYAKLIDLNKEAEPIIAAALSMGGTLIENVPPLPGRRIEDTDPQDLDLTDGSITENTRFAYPLECNPNVADGAQGPHPQTIVLLTADAFGVLPPISVLDENAAMYHFVTGFTSKLAGTEVGVTEPEATFSSCFGAAFMSQKADVYARLLADRMSHHKARCVLLNTGWSGGSYGKGSRISIEHTRALLNAALDGTLDAAPKVTHPVFGLAVPTACPGVPDEMLNPRNTWEDPEAYDTAAVHLRDMFRANFDKNGFASLGIHAAM
jgi:phosphoenolpyruvate carboxykinase (ATP)